MSGPWEDYQATAPNKPSPPPALPKQAGPWDDYVAAPAQSSSSKTAELKGLPKVGQSRSWSDVPLEALSNVPVSAGNFIGSLYQAVRHPLDTAGNVADVLDGAWRKVLPDGGAGADADRNRNPNVPGRLSPQEQKAQRDANIAKADAVGTFFKDRYGSVDGVKNTLATDPVGAALDLSTVLTGDGALATKVPMLAKAGTAAKVAGDAINPVNVALAAARKVPAAVRAAAPPQMAQRIADLRAGGIENPSLGLATGNKFISGVENLLSQTPGSIGLFDRARAENIAGMQAKTEALRDAISTDYGPVTAGQAIQNDLKVNFPERVKQTAKALHEKVADEIGRDTVVPVNSTLAASRRLASPIAGAESTSAEFINPRVARIADSLETDVYGPRTNPVASPSFNPTSNAALPAEAAPSVVHNSSLWNIPVEPIAPLPQARMPVVRTPLVTRDSLTNLPKLDRSLPPLPQQIRPNATLNLPQARIGEQLPVANPSLWNAPVAPRSPLPQRGNVAMRDGRALPNASIWNAQKEQGIPFDALKRLRSSIGEETVSNAIMGTPEQAQFKQLYGALSDDMRQAASSADRTQAGVPVGPLPLQQQGASVALGRANQHYRTAMARADELSGLAKRDTPEGTYKAVANSLQSGPTTYERLRSAVTPEARQKVAATVVDEMGRAAPGVQNATGEIWSARTFLTNYNKLYRNDGGAALFKRLPGGDAHAQNLAKVAKVADMLSDGAKVWANPSGTSQALVARGTIGTIGAGVAGGLFYAPLIAPAATAAGSLLLAHQVSQRLLLNPRFVNWLAKAPAAANTRTVSAYSSALMGAARASGDKQFQQDVREYLQQAGITPSRQVLPLSQLPRTQ